VNRIPTVGSLVRQRPGGLSHRLRGRAAGTGLITSVVQASRNPIAPSWSVTVLWPDGSCYDMAWVDLLTVEQEA